MSRREYLRAWKAAHPERQRAYDAARKGRDTTRYSRRWHEKNPGKNAARARRWRKENPAAVLAQKAKRRADKLQRTPCWADLEKIEQLYEAARSLTLAIDEPFHVDHIIPLRGKRVSGLHVHANLQILPGVENVKKSNNFEVA